MGSDVKRVSVDGGFSGIQADASFESCTTSEAVHCFHRFASGWCFSPEIVDVVVKHALAGREQIDAWRRMLEGWRDATGATAVIAWGEATARKPWPEPNGPTASAGPQRRHMRQLPTLPSYAEPDQLHRLTPKTGRVRIGLSVAVPASSLALIPMARSEPLPGGWHVLRASQQRHWTRSADSPMTTDEP